MIFCNVTGGQAGRFVQWSDARKIYNQAIGGRTWSAIQITTAAAVCAALDLHVAGRLPRRGFVKQEQIDLDAIPRQPLRPLLRRPGRRPASARSVNDRLPVIGGLWRRFACPVRYDHFSIGLRFPPTPAAIAIGRAVAARPRGDDRGPLAHRRLAAGFVSGGVGRGRVPAWWRRRWRRFPPGAACRPRGGASWFAASASSSASTSPTWPRCVSWEVGKITQEALGEVQEMIDMCDFAVGLSRQLYGLTIASERPRHRLAEQWHPLGPVGVITAFNFPVAVWAWNAMLALVCGDAVVWKPSEKTPLCAMACQAIAARVLAEMPEAPRGVLGMVVGPGPEHRAGLGRLDAALPLISATGSVRMGRAVAQTVAARLGRSLLELGGNNGMIVAPSADLEMAVRSIVFAAVGTAGQRCTTLRRLIVHESVADRCLERLLAIYARLPIGNPLEEGMLVGPLIDRQAADAMDEALRQARAARGQGPRRRAG